MITEIPDPSPNGMRTLQETLDSILGRVTTAEPMYLVVFDQVDTYNRVRIKRIRLDFMTNKQGVLEARTSIFLHQHVDDQIFLPIVAGGTDDDSGSWILVDLAAVRVSPENHNEDRLTLVIKRGGDDTVQISEPRQAVSQSKMSWKDFWTRLPPKIDLDRTNRLDLVIAIELSGPAAIVKPRLDFAEQIIQAIFDQPQSRHNIGLIGYRDHQFRFAGAAEQNIIDVAALGSSQPALQKLDRWQHQLPPAELTTPIEDWIYESHGLRQDQYGAPVEDMLKAAGDLTWRDRTRRVLLTLGSRPAHAAHKEPDQAMRCPSGVNWQLEHQQLRANSLRFLAVRDAPTWRINLLAPTIEPSLQERYDAVWKALGLADTPQPQYGAQVPINAITSSIKAGLQAPDVIPLARATR